jgi:hypothetical protein
MTLAHLSGCKVVKREVEVVLPVDRVFRLVGLGEGDRIVGLSRKSNFGDFTSGNFNFIFIYFNNKNRIRVLVSKMTFDSTAK